MREISPYDECRKCGGLFVESRREGETKIWRCLSCDTEVIEDSAFAYNMHDLGKYGFVLDSDLGDGWRVRPPEEETC